MTRTLMLLLSDPGAPLPAEPEPTAEAVAAAAAGYVDVLAALGPDGIPLVQLQAGQPAPWQMGVGQAERLTEMIDAALDWLHEQAAAAPPSPSPKKEGGAVGHEEWLRYWTTDGPLGPRPEPAALFAREAALRPPAEGEGR